MIEEVRSSPEMVERTMRFSKNADGQCVDVTGEIPADKMLLEQGMISINVLNPEKIGDGLSSYVIYTVKTCTDISSFKNSEMSVRRRFSDFLCLYEKLRSVYLQKGIIIPIPPEKNAIGTTKLKVFNKNTDNEFIEKRRLSLESFLQRISRHPLLHKDDSFHEFLESDVDFQKVFSLEHPSGMTAKILKNVGEVVEKWTLKTDGLDEYFDLKNQELLAWDVQSNRIFSALGSLVSDQNDLASSTMTLSKTVSLLANVEEHTGLARTLSQLADTFNQISNNHFLQGEAESVYLLEYSKGLFAIIQSCKETMYEFVRSCKTLKGLENLLRSKRESKVRIEISLKGDQQKLPFLERDICELMTKLSQAEEDLEAMSKTIKQEFEYVDVFRFEEFKFAVIECLCTMLDVHEKMLQTWEAFLVHAKTVD